MVADASIYGLLQKPTDPLDSYGKVANLRALMDKSKLHALQTGKLETDIAEENAYKDVFRNAPTGSSLESLLPEAYKASPKAAVDLQGKILTQQKDRASLDKTGIEIQAAKAKDARDTLAGVTDQASWDAWKQYAGSKGYQVAAQAPDVFDPKWQQQHVMTADAFIQTQQKQLDRDVTLKGQAETERFHKAQALHNDLTLAETGRHHKALEGDPKTIEDTAQAISKGQLAPLSGFALSRPMAQNIMARVVQINPDFDPTQFATRQKAEKDFGTGKQGTAVKSFNVAISHLGTLDQLTDALNNGNVQLINKIGNTYATQSGGTAPTDFNAAKKIVADEIVKAIVGSGGGVHDREEAAKTIDAANSPAQLKGVIKQYKELMKGQLDGLRKQYEATTGKSDFDKKFLSEAAQGVAHDKKPAEVKPGDQVKAKTGVLVPVKGAVQDGYRFKGGDPADQASWERL